MSRGERLMSCDGGLEHGCRGGRAQKDDQRRPDQPPRGPGTGVAGIELMAQEDPGSAAAELEAHELTTPLRMCESDLQFAVGRCRPVLEAGTGVDQTVATYSSASRPGFLREDQR